MEVLVLQHPQAARGGAVQQAVRPDGLKAPPGSPVPQRRSPRCCCGRSTFWVMARPQSGPKGPRVSESIRRLRTRRFSVLLWGSSSCAPAVVLATRQGGCEDTCSRRAHRSLSTRPVPGWYQYQVGTSTRSWRLRVFPAFLLDH